MTQSRIDLLLFLEAHKDSDSTAAMDAMIRFDRIIGEAFRSISASIKDKKSPAARIEIYQKVLASALAVGARDLCDQTYVLLSSLQSQDTSNSAAKELAWVGLAEQTKAANFALLQACEFFGRALNGKKLPEDSKSPATTA